MYLVEEEGVPPQGILALTFTRAAAHELRTRVRAHLDAETQPRISTLHSFALRQLLRNRARIDAVPQPLRIADDWEERHIIEEDLKAILALGRVSEARELFNRLAADWQSLNPEEGAWDPDARFIGAWREHRGIFGYTLRSEMVYQLKRALEQVADFSLDHPIRHLLIDEYQDLNQCDLAVMRMVARQGVEVFCAGDDDQSIYGFRKAHPDGIRNFPEEYDPCQNLPLELCRRCDPEILGLALFVARLDPRRVPKELRPEEGRGPGEVALLRFGDQGEEARSVARMCSRLIDSGHAPGQILILLRSDFRRAFSSVIVDALRAEGVPVPEDTGVAALSSNHGQAMLSVLRLIDHERDDLAWRTLLQLRRNGVGEGALRAIYEQCRNRNERFAAALQRITDSPGDLPRSGGALQREVRAIRALLEEYSPVDVDGEDPAGPGPAPDLHRDLDLIARSTIADAAARAAIVEELLRVAEEADAQVLPELLVALASSDSGIEQIRDPERVNILTMHRAKGLTADTVFVVGVEDEHLPGRQEVEPELGDERRLLYVSLTRARHRLYCTFCERRRGQQAQMGRTAGRARRTLTRFLRDAPVAPQQGSRFVAGFRPIREDA